MTNLAITSEILDRQPPRSLEAERAVLGSMMLLPDVCDEVALIVRPDDFYDEANRRIYRRLMRMHEEGRRTDDLVLLFERLKAAGDAEFVGGVPYLNELLTSTGSAAHAGHYAGIIAELSTKRQVIILGTELLQRAYDGDSSAADLLRHGATNIDRLAVGADRGNVVTARHAIDQAMVRIRSMLNEPARSWAVRTGLLTVDSAIGGLYAGELTVCGGRPGDGKTALALQIATLHAREGSPVLFCSTEMAASELATRALCSVAMISSNWIRTGSIAPGDQPALEAAAEELAPSSLFIDDRPNPSVAELRTGARRLHHDQPLRLVVVDYLQRLRPSDPRRQRHEQVGELAADLKTLARELSVPVLVLAQLNRAATSDGRPTLANLRESGTIEAEADQVWLLHRPELAKPKDPDLQGKAELIAAKNRNGETGSFPLVWQSGLTLFSDPETPPGVDPVNLF
jgi:replicative DNA helicase